MSRLLFKDLAVPANRVNMHVTRLAGPQSSQPHTHDFYEVFLVLDGGGIHHLNRSDVPLTPGQMVAVGPKDTHWFSAAPGETLVFVNVAVSAPWWRATRVLLGKPEWDKAHRTATLGPADTRRLGSELRRLSLTDDPLILIRVWKEVTNAFAPKPAPAAPPAPKWLEALRQEIVASPQFLGEPIAYWQRRSDRSSEHVSRSCRKYYGMTFRDLLNHARVNRAKYVLRTTDKKVITVAFECGFGNMAHFHRTFARLCGISPHRWRQAGNATVPVT